ncbi:TPA: hypothetical protein HA278_00715, partial [Candidatus Woesearchaeota archaeon]|nr:hypothetical protein [Candidatus Woesearchaeota archaeon]
DLYFLFDIGFVLELKQLQLVGYDLSADQDVREIAEESRHLYGMVSTAPSGSTGEDCNDAAIVNFAAAKDGWGPTTYDIVMGLHPHGIISDRGSVSSEAFDLWKFYKDKRQDIEKKPLDYVDYQWTESTKDDCGPGSDGDYLPSEFYNNFSGQNTKQKAFLKDPLSWSYNRGPVPGMEQLVANWDFATAMAEENDITQFESDGFWEYLARGFFGKLS